LKDPLNGALEVIMNKVCRFVFYGTRFFDVSGGEAGLNGKLVLISKDPTGPGEIKTIMTSILYGNLYQLEAIAEVDGILFDAFAVNKDDSNNCSFLRDSNQLEGIVSADLASGSLGVKIKECRSDPSTGGGDTDCLVGSIPIGIPPNPNIPTDPDNYTLGVAGDPALTGTPTALELNIGTVQPDPNNYPTARGVCPMVTDYWNNTLTAWAVECRFKVPTLNPMGGAGRDSVVALAADATKGALTMLVVSAPSNEVQVQYRFNNGSFIALRILPSFDTEVWHHYLAQWTGTNLEVYLDGVLRARTPLTESPGHDPGSTPVTQFSEPVNNLMIGANRERGGFYEGKVQEIRVSKTARFTGATNVGDPSTEGVPTAAFVPDSDTLRLYHLNEADPGPTVLTTTLTDSGPIGSPSADDIEANIDDINMIAEG